MKTDISRSTFRKSKNYSAVRMQQGRVVLDTDWNEQVDIENDRNRILTVDSLGPVGAPAGDAGFQISPSGDTLDLLVSPGRFYVDGILIDNAAEFNVSAQTDLPGIELPTTDGNYLAYLKVHEQAVTALEDPEIRETALGGPDTTTRSKVIRQILLTPVTGTEFDSRTIPAEWTAITSRNPGRMSARTEAEGTTDPCAVGTRGGYTGLDNLLYRVEIHDAGQAGTATYKWSRDNGALVTEWLEQEGDTLTLRSTGNDNVLNFAPGQWIEISDDGMELEGLPGTLTQILRVEGRRITINPDNIRHFPGSAGTLDINEFSRGVRKVRRWDMVDLVSPPTVPDGAGGEVWITLENGIEIKFDDLASGREFRTGDYWMIPARADNNNIQWACDNAGNIEHDPDGIYYSYARLAFVTVAAGAWSVIADAREIFPGLTDEELSYVGGDGQLSVPGETLDRPLEVRVTRGATPVADAKVRFTVTGGTGTIEDAPGGTAGTTLDIKADANGIARVYWTLADADAGQSVTAVLLDDTDQTTALYVTFGAGSGVASGIQYTPISADASVAGTTNVQDALDALADNKVNRTGDTITGDLEVQGNFTVRGDVIARDAQQQAGDVLLGDDDIDRVIIHGTLESNHTSGALEIEGPVHISSTDPTKSPLRVDGPSTGGSARLFRTPIDVDHTDGSAVTLTDYQLLLTLDTATRIAAGRMQTDGSDILFQDEDGTALPFWIESDINTAATRIWVRVPAITAGANRTIYMLHGNDNAVSQSSSSAVFVREVPDVQIAYELNEGSGTSATDLSGNGLSGTVQGTANWVAGQFGQALDFDGSTTLVSMPAGNFVGNGATPFTASLWLRPESTGNTIPLRLTQDTQFIISLSSFGIDGGFRTAENHPLPVNLATLQNQWNHLAVAYNGGDKNLPASFEIYLNGTLLDSSTANLTIGPIGGAFNDNALGSDVNGSGVNFNFFDGQMSDVRVYTRVLAQAEVTDIYNNKGYVTLANPGVELVRRFAGIEPLTTPQAEEANPLSDTPILFAQETSGNVGIGTDNPDQKFTVDGVIHTLQGGIQFPDGTIQTTAGGTGGGGGDSLPLGTIMAWHRDFAGAPAVPDGWVECNGQILDDADSPYDGLVIPNLNGEERFLRGGAASGVPQEDAFQGHFHTITRDGGEANNMFWANQAGGDGGFVSRGGISTGVPFSVGSARSDGPNGTPRVADETRPVNMSVVWIMKVKLVDGQSGLWVPGTEGIRYDAGKVSVGTAVADEQLTVSGAISLEEKILEPDTSDDFGKIYVRENDLSHLRLNGTDQYVSMPVMNRPAFGDNTFALWFRIDETLFQVGDFVWFLDSRPETTEDPGMELILQAQQNNAYNLYYSINWPSSGSAQAYIALGSISSEWHHVALSREGAVVRLYVDGRLVSSEPSVGGPAKSDPFNWNAPWRVGRRSNDANPAYYAFPGSLDDLGIWERALTQDEIAALHNGGRGSDVVTGFASSLLAFYPMSPSLTAGQLDDTSGNDFHGTIQNGASIIPERVGSLYFKDGFGNVTALAGGGDSYRTGGSGNQVPLGTIMAWHKSFANTPAIPDGWVECNGQTLDDPASPYNGQTIPDLNNPKESWNSKGSFLRGDLVSGDFEDDVFQGHIHQTSGVPGGIADVAAPGGPGSNVWVSTTNKTTTDPITGSNGTPRIGDETNPVNMSVVWIMKVRETDRDRGLWRENGEDIYFDDGKVGVGAKTANAKLHVSAEDGTETPFRIDGQTTLQGVQGRLYRNGITLENTDTTDLIDHQVVVTLDTQALVSAGKMRFDGGDILFVDTDGKTILPHYIETGINTVATRIWIRVPAILAGETRLVFIQYGKPDTTSPGSAPATFIQSIDNVALAWNFEEGPNTTIIDQTGKGNDATGGLGQSGIGGYRGGALLYNGTQGVSTNNQTWGFSNTMSISAWINTSDANTSTLGTIATLQDGSQNNEVLLTVGTTGIPGFNVQVSAGNAVSRNALSNVETGNWVHIVGIVDGGINAAQLRIYVNGVREEGAIGINGTPALISDASPRGFYVGGRPGAGEYFNGIIDQVRLYSRALTDQEVADIYSNESLILPDNGGRELIYKASPTAPTISFAAEEPNPVSGSPVLFAQNLTGNIGIGTDEPLARLHIAGTAGVDGIMFPDGTVQTTAGGGGGGDSTPLGTIIAWHKSLGGTPAIPDGWVECNGQTLSDIESPYDGLVIPDLNNPKNPWNTKGSFLRGDTTSGTFEDDEFQGHWHPKFVDALIAAGFSGDGGRYADNETLQSGTVKDPVDGTNGTVRFGDETRPVNMAVVWIIKVKQSAATNVWQINGTDTYYDDGNVAIGTDSANAKLTIDGDLSLKEGGTVPDADPGFGKVYAQENTLRHLQFDGVGDYVSMPALAQIGVNDFTISCWFKMDAHNPFAANPFSYLMDFRGDGAMNSGPAMVIRDADLVGAEFWPVLDQPIDGRVENRYNVGQLVGQWHHAVFVREGMTLRSFIDGILVSDISNIGTSTGEQFDMNQGWRLGTQSSGTTPGQDFWLNGSLAQIVVWRRAVAAYEIASIFAGGRELDVMQNHAPNLVGYWPIDANDSGTTILDHSGNGFHGTLQANTSFENEIAGSLYYKDGRGTTTTLAGANSFPWSAGSTGRDVPIGTIMAWHKDLSGTPAIPDGWVECNGQLLVDAQSPYNGQTIPDLNNPKETWNTKGSFLRGDSTSGVFEDDAFQGHWHDVLEDGTGREAAAGFPTDSGATTGVQSRNSTNDINTFYASDLRDDGVNGTPRSGAETRSVNMSVVWIMKVRHTGNGVWIDVPQGVSFDAGDVGIGTTAPVSRLTVDGALSLREDVSTPGATLGFGKLYTRSTDLSYLELDGNADYVTMPALGAATVGDFAVSIWFRLRVPNALLTDPSYMLDMRDETGAVNGGPHLLLAQVGNSDMRLTHALEYIEFPGTATTQFEDNIGNVIGEWHHTVHVREGGVVRQYLDGRLISDNPTLVGPPQSNVINFNSPWRIGTRKDATAGAGSFWHGSLDDAAVWNRALSDSEIAAIHNAGRGTDLTTRYSTNLLGFWPMDDGASATTIRDASGNGFDGSLQNGAVIVEEQAGALLFQDGFGNTTTLAGSGGSFGSSGGGREVPLGTIMAWHKDLTGTPSMPPGWVECNGQTLSDIESPYDGEIIPNLNGDPAGADSPDVADKKSMFLRGGLTSGTGQDDAFQGHHHIFSSASHSAAFDNAYQIGSGKSVRADSGPQVQDPSDDGVNGTPRTADETRPVNMSVVWIMKIKHIGDAAWEPATNGLSYMGGRVGIGTTTPAYELDVNGTIRGANVSPSDVRWKTDIQDFEGAVGLLQKLRGVRFNWDQTCTASMTLGAGPQLGLIAQEVEAVLPEVVSTAPDGYKSIEYGKLVAVLIEAIKELTEKN